MGSYFSTDPADARIMKMVKHLKWITTALVIVVIIHSIILYDTYNVMSQILDFILED